MTRQRAYKPRVSDELFISTYRVLSAASGHPTVPTRTLGAALGISHVAVVLRCPRLRLPRRAKMGAPCRRKKTPKRRPVRFSALATLRPDELNPRERDLVWAMRALESTAGRPAKAADIGRILGVSRQRASQLMDGARTKVRRLVYA